MKELKRKFMLSFNADLLIRHQNFAFCLQNLLLPSSSMEIFRESMESMDEFYPFFSQIHPHYKHIMATESRKNGKKARRHEEDEKLCSNTRRTAVHPATHDRAPPTTGRGGLGPDRS